jgi:hypothetical protein
VSGDVVLRRIDPEDDDLMLRDGEYGKHPRDGKWYVRLPGGHMGNLGNHEVTEHEDGTITVRPSVLIKTPGYLGTNATAFNHGFIDRGVWRSC